MDISNPEQHKRLHAVVQGRVQGVGFRQYVQQSAAHLQIVGFCRNLRSGDVEVVAEGVKGALEALLVSLNVGPTMSRIDNIHAIWLPATGEFRSFAIASTR